MNEGRQPGRAAARGSAETKVAWPRRTQFFLLTAASIGLAVYGSLVPLRFTPISFSTALRRFAETPMLKLGVQSRADWVANILLFVPVGSFAVGALCVDRRRRWAVLAIVPVAACCAALSVTIEFTQLWFPPRTVSQNDIVAETIGGLVGCLLWVFAGQTLTNWLRTYTRHASPKWQVDWLLQAYLLGFVIYSVLPLDLTISVADLYRKFASGRFVAVPFTYSYGSLFAWVYQMAKDILVFAPIGAWSATAFVGRGRQVRSLGQSVLIGGLIVVTIELSQLLVYSRFTDTTDIITGTGGVALGAALMRHLRGATRVGPVKKEAAAASFAWLKWLGIAALYAAFVTAGYWFPFDFSADKPMIKERLAGFFGVPFRAMYSGSEFKALSNLLQKTLFFAPLGALVTVAACRMPVPDAVRRIVLVGLLVVCFAVAFGIELGQVLSPRHTPDFTDVLLCTAGALAGMVVTARLQLHRK
jgi:glycopeptide antibiotics resistance protein